MTDDPGSWDDLEPFHELRTIEELRVVSDPLRVAVCRLLKEKERTVKELCDLLGETSTRLYYHVGELERVGLVRLVRTETVSGSTQKYYRAVARYFTIPFAMLQDERGSERARAGVEWYVSFLEAAAKDLRYALSDGIQRTAPEQVFITRSFVRTTEERAKSIVQKLEELRREIEAADEEGGDFRATFTAVFVPTLNFVAEPARDAISPAETSPSD